MCDHAASRTRSVNADLFTALKDGLAGAGRVARQAGRVAGGAGSITG